MAAVREASNVHVRGLDNQREEFFADCAEKEKQAHQHAKSIEQKSIISAFELPGRLHIKVKAKNGDTVPESQIPPPPPLPTSAAAKQPATTSSSGGGSGSGGSSSSSSSSSSSAKVTMLTGDWYGKSKCKKLPTAAAAEKAQAQVDAYRSEAHFKPGIKIDDPLDEGIITVANPAVIANITSGGRFQYRARFLCGEGKVWEYPLGEVSMALRRALKGDGNGKGKGKAEVGTDPSPLATEPGDESDDGEADADSGSESDQQDADEKEDDDTDYHFEQ
jgi:hypothetical protein